MLLLPVVRFGNQKLPSFRAALKSVWTRLADGASQPSASLIVADSRASASAFGRCPGGRLGFFETTAIGHSADFDGSRIGLGKSRRYCADDGYREVEGASRMIHERPFKKSLWRMAHLREPRKCISCKR